MARSAKRAEPDILPPTISPDVGITLIKRQIEKGQGLLNAGAVGEDEYNAWVTLSEEVVVKAFGRNSDKHYSFLNAGPGAVVLMYQQPAAWYEDRRRKRLAAKISELTALVSVLELEIEVSVPHRHVEVPVLAAASSDVFIVHGHDGEVRNDIARFLEKLRLNAVILHEQPNKGRTLIEKFTDHANVGFAVVLLTADDRGGPYKDPYDAQKSRARQNVIFELGFFVGKLGRNRVCALYQQGVEIPSDYAGVIYILLDEVGAWRLALARELKSAGFDIDMNRAL